MTIKGLKWGSSRTEDEAYVAGIRIASDACELTVLDGDKLIYVGTRYYTGFHEVRVSDHSLFAEYLALDGCEEEEVDKIMEEIDSDLIASELFENDVNECWTEEGKYYEDAIEISVSCMNAFFENECVGNADDFIKPYIGMDVKNARFEIVDGGYQQQMKEAELLSTVNEMAEKIACRLVDMTRRGQRLLSINVTSNGRIVVTDEKNERIVDRWLDSIIFKDWQNKEVSHD